MKKISFIIILILILNFILIGKNNILRWRIQEIKIFTIVDEELDLTFFFKYNYEKNKIKSIEDFNDGIEFSYNMNKITKVNNLKSNNYKRIEILKFKNNKIFCDLKIFEKKNLTHESSSNIIYSKCSYNGFYTHKPNANDNEYIITVNEYIFYSKEFIYFINFFFMMQEWKINNKEKIITYTGPDYVNEKSPIKYFAEYKYNNLNQLNFITYKKDGNIIGYVSFYYNDILLNTIEVLDQNKKLLGKINIKWEKGKSNIKFLWDIHQLDKVYTKSPSSN